MQKLHSTVAFGPLCPLTPSQPNSLPILLQLRYELIALLYYVIVLLILIVWSICFNYTFTRDSVDSAGYSVSRNELRKVTDHTLVWVALRG